MTSTATIFDYREPWQGSVALSAILHAALAVGIVGYSFFAGGRGQEWGGAVSADGAMSVNLVSTAVPLPARSTEQENVLANESRGLSTSKPVQAPPEAEAIAIPDKAVQPTKPQALPPTPKTKPPVKPVEQATNVIPYGEGGPASFNYTLVKTSTGTGGISMGQDGSFGSRYSWYVDAVRRKVSDNWFKYEVDSSITSARRVYISFAISRGGEPTDIQISQSSGVPSLDISAKRALQRIDTFGPLPNDYRGGDVKVEFWFDYKK